MFGRPILSLSHALCNLSLLRLGAVKIATAAGEWAGAATICSRSPNAQKNFAPRSMPRHIGFQNLGVWDGVVLGGGVVKDAANPAPSRWRLAEFFSRAQHLLLNRAVFPAS